MTDELRSELDRLAAEAPPPGERRDEVLAKARRRGRASIALAGVVAVATVVASVLAVGALIDRRSTVPIGPSPTGTVHASDTTAPTAAPLPTGRIAFLRAGVAVTVDVDGGEMGSLGPLPGMRTGGISLSPDGSHLVFDRAISSVAGSIEVMDTTDGTVTPLLTLPHIPRSPDWSPTGERIAFVTDSSALFTMAADGSDRRWIGGNLLGEEPSWSPDGARVAYITPDGDVAVVGARENARPEVIASVGEARSLDWGPGPAGRIVFQTSVAGERFLYVVNPDGTGLRPLVEAPGSYGQPSWSPDGAFVAFTDVVGERTDVFVVPGSGGAPTRITTDVAQEFSPVWLPQS